jgi:hypothetical protein
MTAAVCTHIEFTADDILTIILNLRSYSCP